MSKFYKWLSDFNTRDKYPFDYNSSSKTFWCQPCEQAVPAVQKSQLKQHLESEKHRKNLGLKRSLVQSRLEFQDPKKQCISRQEQVNQDLCNAFLAANIPLNKLNYPVLKDCLEKNIGLAIAGVDTFRQKYVPKSYEIAMEHIKEDLDGKNVWMSIDETTDSVGRKVANVIVGELNAIFSIGNGVYFSQNRENLSFYCRNSYTRSFLIDFLLSTDVYDLSKYSYRLKSFFPHLQMLLDSTLEKLHH